MPLPHRSFTEHYVLLFLSKTIALFLHLLRKTKFTVGSSCFYLTLDLIKQRNQIMSIQPVTEREIKQLSLPLIGALDALNFRRIDHERFKAKFGVTVELCVKAWNLMVSNLNKGHIDLKNIRLRPVHVLYALFFLKCYPTHRQTTSNLGHGLNMATFCKYSYFVIRQVAALSDEVVS